MIWINKPPVHRAAVQMALVFSGLAGIVSHHLCLSAPDFGPDQRAILTLFCVDCVTFAPCFNGMPVARWRSPYRSSVPVRGQLRVPVCGPQALKETLGPRTRKVAANDTGGDLGEQAFQ